MGKQKKKSDKAGRRYFLKLLVALGPFAALAERLLSFVPKERPPTEQPVEIVKKHAADALKIHVSETMHLGESLRIEKL